jgi:excisionase family DNA binding protein
LLNLSRLLRQAKPVRFKTGRDEIEVPAAAVSILVRALDALCSEGGVDVVPVARELTTQQAANLLNVSRQYVARLVDDGTLKAAVTEGGHRRIRLHDLLAFRTMRDAKRGKALDELEELSESLGGYSALKR